METEKESEKLQVKLKEAFAALKEADKCLKVAQDGENRAFSVVMGAEANLFEALEKERCAQVLKSIPIAAEN